MKVVFAFLFGLLVAVVKSETNIIPDHYEMAYQYEALVSNSIKRPKLFSSSYRIRYQLSATNLAANTTLVQIKNVTYAMHNGQGAEHNGVLESIPSEAQQLQAPFIIVRDSEGIATMIKTQKDDPVWSVNMKRGIVSLLQINTPSTRKEGASNERNTEYTTYGQCSIMYTTLPIDKNRFNIEKTLNPFGCMDLKNSFRGSFQVERCGYTDNYNPLSIASTNVYEMEEIDGNLFANTINGVNTIILSAFNGNSDGYSMTVRQSMDKIDARKVDQYPTVDTTTMQEHKMKASFVLEYGVPSDFIGGRGQYDLDEITNGAFQIFTLAAQEFDDAEDSNMPLRDNNPEILEDLIKVLRLLDRKHFGILFEMFNKKPTARSLFYQILPVVGTNSAALFFRDLIFNKKVDNADAKLMLEVLPSHIRQPDRELLKEFISLRSTIDPELKSTFELSLASITSKVHVDYSDDAFVQKCVDEFVEKFTTSVDEEERVLYVNALTNMDTIPTDHLLERIMNGKVKASSLVRSLAIWALGKEHINLMIIWPIFRDQTLPLEIRAAALGAIIKNLQSDDLLMLQQHMTNEPNPDLYSMYYTSLVSISNSKAPCHAKTALEARYILSAIRIPPGLAYNSYDRFQGYFDELYQFGLSLRTTWVGDIVMDDFTSLRIEPTSHLLEYEWSEDVFHFTESSNGTSSIPRMIHFRNNQVISIVTPDRETGGKEFFYDYFRDMIFSLGYEKKTRNTFGLKYDSEVVFPTDLGTPALVWLQTGTKQRFSYEFPEETNWSYNLSYSVDFNQVNSRIYGLKVYNPILDLWHGVRRNHVTNTRLPLYARIHLLQILVELDLSTSESGKIEGAKFESTSFSDVFTEGIIGKYAYKYTKYSQVSYGKGHGKSEVLWEHGCPMTLTKYKFEVFDCERPLTSSRLSKLKQSIFGDDNKNWGAIPLMKIPLMLRHLLAYSITSPAPGQCGIRLTATPVFNRTRLFAGRTLDGQKGFMMNQTYYIGDETRSWNIDLHFIDESSPYVLDYFDNMLGNVTDMQGNKLCFARELVTKGLKRESIFVGYSGKNETSECWFERPDVNVTVLSEFKPRSTNTDDDAFEECRMSGKTILTCAAEQSYYDKFTYNINYENGPNTYVKLWNKFVETFRNSFSSMSTRKHLENKGEPGKATIVVEYEPFSNEPDVLLTTPNEQVKYKNIPIEDNLFWKYMYLRDSFQIPYNIDNNVMQNIDDAFGECVIQGNHFFDTRGAKLPLNVSTEWSAFIDYNYDNSTVKPLVSVRRDKTTKSLEVEVVWYTSENKQVLIIKPKEKSVEITLNGKTLETSSGYHRENPIYYKVTQKSAIVFLDSYFVPYLFVTGDSVEAAVRLGYPFVGLCHAYMMVETITVP